MKRTLFGCLSLALVACSAAVDDKLIGYVEAETVYVAAPEGGWIIEQPLREGDAVSSGDILFRLDAERQEALVAAAEGRALEARSRAEDIEEGARAPEISVLEAQLEEARARLVQAKSERKRWMPLVETGDASRAKGDQVTADYRAALARVNAAADAIEVARLAGRKDARAAADAAALASQAALREARWSLEQRTVKSRVSGRIETIVSRRGEFVAAGAPVLSIMPDGATKVRFFAPQSVVAGLSPGDAVNVRADGREEVLAATVTFIASEAEFTPPVIFSTEAREKLVFLVEARFAPGRAPPPPGLPVDVYLSREALDGGGATSARDPSFSFLGKIRSMF